MFFIEICCFPFADIEIMDISDTSAKDSNRTTHFFEFKECSLAWLSKSRRDS